MYKKMILYRELLLDEISQLEKAVAAAPEGTFVCSKEGSYYRWVKYHKGRKTVIKKNDIFLAQDLVEKRYNSLRLYELRAELAAVNMYLESHCFKSPSQEFLSKSCEISKLLYEKNTPEELTKWANESYESSAGHPENLIVRTSDGRMVRSKSEAAIYDALRQSNVAFRYECDIELNGKTFCPDFTIKLLLYSKAKIWEHFGMMDDPEYRRYSMAKLTEYSLAGYVLGVDLIATTETKEHPFTLFDAKIVIQNQLRI